MAWVAPKITWLTSDYINYTDLNRIKNNVLFLYDKIVPINGTTTIELNQSEAYNIDLDYSSIGDDEKLIYNVTATPDEFGEEPITIHIVVDRHGYDITMPNGVTRHYTNDTISIIMPFDGTLAINEIKIHGIDEYFTLDNMVAYRLNDYWYAEDFQIVIENIDKICTALNVSFNGKPYYSANGATPTAQELNIIERTELDIYNKLTGAFTLYLGVGYSGSRITNTLL